MKSILLVDDERMIIELIERELVDHGYQCFLAETADEAITILQKNRIDLVLLDINMPGRSGIDLLQEIKAHSMKTATIMVTAVEDDAIINRCLEMGADDYILKPFHPQRIYVSVRNALQKQEFFIANQSYQGELKRKLSEQEEKLKTSQALLIQQEKLASIGQLAAGVAHEINNPVGYISSNLSSLGKYAEKISVYLCSLEEDFSALSDEQQEQIRSKTKKFKINYILEDMPDLISEGLDGAARIQKIVQNLKCFSRKDCDSPTSVDINECLESAITIIWNEIKYTAEIERDFGELPPVNGFSQQLGQVFMNLIINASHAIDKDGLIRIGSSYENGNVVVSICDNGCGISEANLAKIFDPFFTTKAPGKGTGLGMSIASEIIQKHGGTINVQSIQNEGTTFIISLPESGIVSPALD